MCIWLNWEKHFSPIPRHHDLELTEWLWHHMLGCFMFGKEMALKSLILNLFSTRDQFYGDKFFHGWDGGDGAGGNVSDGSGNASDGEPWWSFTPVPVAHLLLCSPVLNRPRIGAGLPPGGADPCLKWQQTKGPPASQVLSSLDTFLKVKGHGPYFYGIYSLVWIELNVKARRWLETLVIHPFGPLSW